MQNFNFNHLYYFHVAASEGGLAAAAKVLNVTQPTISEQIKQLEAFLDAKLFHRKVGGNMRLSEAGRLVFDHTAIMFRTSSRLLSRFRSDIAEDVQMLSIGVASPVSRTFAARFFLPLLEVEGLRPRISSGDHDYLLHELVTLELDVLLTDTPPRDPESKGLECRPLHDPAMLIVTCPELAEQVKEVPDDLCGLPFFGYSATSRYRWEFDAYFRDAGLYPRIIAESDDVDLMRSAAAHGLCAAILPDTVAESELASGALIELGRVATFESRVWALYHRKDTPQRVLDAIDRLTQPSVQER